MSRFLPENLKIYHVIKKFTPLLGTHKKIPPFPTLRQIIPDHASHPIPFVVGPF
jgi:hypothetical protein